MIVNTRSVCRVLRIGLAVLVVAFVTPLPALAQCQGDTSMERATAIANGHSFEKHHAEFVQGESKKARVKFPGPTITSKGEFATFINGIMTKPTYSKELINKRIAYWDTRTGTVVILDLLADDCGTAFRPYDGLPFYNQLI